MNIGELNKRIQIQQAVLLPDGEGGYETTWVDYGEPIFAKYTSRRHYPRATEQHKETSIDATFKARYNAELFDFNPGEIRIKFKNRFYYPTARANVDSMECFMEIHTDGQNIELAGEVE